MTFADTLKARRTQLNLTQAQLAVLLDVDKQSISNYETGRSTPWASVQARLEARMAELAGEGPAMTPTEAPVAAKRPRVIDRIKWDD